MTGQIARYTRGTVGTLGMAAFAAAAACGGGGKSGDAVATRAPDTVAAAPAPAVSPATTSPVSPASGKARDSSVAPRQAIPAAQPSAGPRTVVIHGIDFTGIGHDRGNPAAKVVVVDLSDFGCPYCGQFARETYPAIERDYVATGKVFFKYVPFIAGSFPHAREATRAAECAADQHRFWEMFDRIYATQAEWRRGSNADADMAALAGPAGLNAQQFAACYAEGRTDARIARATGIANDIGVRVTPSFLVNDRPVQGALPLADFRRVIDAALLLAETKP